MGQRKVKNDNLSEKALSNPPMLTRKSKSEQQTQSSNAVFNNPLVFDKIVKYSIYTANGKEIDKQTTAAIRLVNKSFLQSASRIFKKSGDCAIELDISELYDRNKVEKYVWVFAHPFRAVNSILPISLEINQRHWPKATNSKLNRLFERCSDLIVTLCVKYLVNRGSKNNLTCDYLSFPILQNFAFKFETWGDTDALPPSETIPEGHAKCLKFLQCILLYSPNLKHFTLKNDNEGHVNMDSLKLPGTLKGMRFDGPLTQNGLNLLTNNQLSNLNALDFDIYKKSEVQLIYKILEHFKEQLTSLTMNLIDNDSGNEDSSICLKLPLLKKLQVFRLSGREDSQFDIKTSVVLSTFLPNLTCVVFKYLKESVFLHLIQGSRFEKVDKFKLSLLRTKIKVSPTAQMMSKINDTFPQIQRLNLLINFNETGGLEYLFQNFTLLRKLRLDLVFGEDSDGSYTIGYKMVSLFLGISLELAIALVDKTEKNTNVPTDNPGSIMNLKELTSLTLSTPRFNCSGRVKNPLCSEVFSTYGLGKMPKLGKIKLLGGFEIQHGNLLV